MKSLKEKYASKTEIFEVEENVSSHPLKNPLQGHKPILLSVKVVYPFYQ